MKKKLGIIIVVAFVILAIALSLVGYSITRDGRCSVNGNCTNKTNNDCDTNGVRPATCIPANNRCLPPGDPREATVDCLELRYYQP